jgi:hypothetical protein
MKITIKMDGQQVYFTAEGKEYRTNKSGEGLWAWRQSSAYDLHDNKYVYEWQQVEGTCQFSLRQSTRSGIRKAIERYFRDVVEG